MAAEPVVAAETAAEWLEDVMVEDDVPLRDLVRPDA